MSGATGKNGFCGLDYRPSEHLTEEGERMAFFDRLKAILGAKLKAGLHTGQ